jgi:hypothetical protein
MEYKSIEQFIKEHLRYKQHWNKKQISMQDAHWQELKNDTHVGGIDYAKGSIFKVFETRNFGWIVFRRESLTPAGNTPGKFIHKW